MHLKISSAKWRPFCAEGSWVKQYQLKAKFCQYARVCTCKVFHFNTLRPRQNGRCFADDTFKRIFLNENIIISIKISLKFVPMVRINSTPALVQIMTWRWPGDRPLSGPMMVFLTDAYMRHPASMNYAYSNKSRLYFGTNTIWRIYFIR